MELKDTIDLMTSDDYKKRFEAEYYQLVIRYNKLKKLVNDWENGKLNFRPSGTLDAYHRQLEAMQKYISILEFRALIEDVDLEDIKY